MRVIDPGHYYGLATIDGEADYQAPLRFVKRVGDNYPGNTGLPYPGTTMQEVLRALIDRAGYVNRQIPCAETGAAIGLLETALLLFEIRAKRVKGQHLDCVSVHIAQESTCAKCGHVRCEDHAK